MEKHRIDFAPSESRTFEIDLVLRDAAGKPILDANGNVKRKSYAHNNPYKIDEFWNRYKGKPKRKKKKMTEKENKEAVTALEEINKANEQKLIEREKEIE